MRECFQFESVSMLDHGLSVRSWYLDLIGSRSREWRLPEWIGSTVAQGTIAGIDDRLVGLYQVYHDCGKPLCRTVDAEGRQHFPDHARASAERWLSLSDGSAEARWIGDMMSMDMDVHRLRACDVDGFAARSEAVMLLVTGLCELHSNAAMFGGIDSTGFKIKFENIDRFGSRIIAAKERE